MQSPHAYTFLLVVYKWLSTVTPFSVYFIPAASRPSPSTFATLPVAKRTTSYSIGSVSASPFVVRETFTLSEPSTGKNSFGDV